MDGWNFIITSEKLRDSSQECDRRTSISRSYYGALNDILGALAQRGVEVKREAVHSVCQWLRGCDEPSLRVAGTKLDGLRAMRIDADYKMALLASDFSSAQTHVALREAREARRQYCTVPAGRASEAVVAYLESTNQLSLVVR